VDGGSCFLARKIGANLVEELRFFFCFDAFRHKVMQTADSAKHNLWEDVKHQIMLHTARIAYFSTRFLMARDRSIINRKSFLYEEYTSIHRQVENNQTKTKKLKGSSYWSSIVADDEDSRSGYVEVARRRRGRRGQA
jgi:hypothetical protein